MTKDEVRQLLAEAPDFSLADRNLLLDILFFDQEELSKSEVLEYLSILRKEVGSIAQPDPASLLVG